MFRFFGLFFTVDGKYFTYAEKMNFFHIQRRDFMFDVKTSARVCVTGIFSENSSHLHKKIISIFRLPTADTVCHRNLFRK